MDRHSGVPQRECSFARQGALGLRGGASERTFPAQRRIGAVSSRRPDSSVGATPGLFRDSACMGRRFFGLPGRRRRSTPPRLGLLSGQKSSTAAPFRSSGRCGSSQADRWRAMLSSRSRRLDLRSCASSRAGVSGGRDETRGCASRSGSAAACGPAPPSGTSCGVRVPRNRVRILCVLRSLSRCMPRGGVGGRAGSASGRRARRRSRVARAVLAGDALGSSRRTGRSVSGAGPVGSYWPAMLWCSSRRTCALGLTTAPAAVWLPYWAAMLWCSSRSVWALGCTSVSVAGGGDAASGPIVVVAR